METGLTGWQLAGTVLTAAIVLGAILMAVVAIIRYSPTTSDRDLRGWGYYRYLNRKK